MIKWKREDNSGSHHLMINKWHLFENLMDGLVYVICPKKFTRHMSIAGQLREHFAQLV